MWNNDLPMDDINFVHSVVNTFYFSVVLTEVPDR